MILIDGRHLRAARGLLAWTQEQLSDKSKVALGTIKRMETADGNVTVRTDTVQKLVSVLEKAGIEFLNDDRPGVRLKPQPPAPKPVSKQ